MVDAVGKFAETKASFTEMLKKYTSIRAPQRLKRGIFVNLDY